MSAKKIRFYKKLRVFCSFPSCHYRYLDFLNIMAYDFHGKWESQTGHNAPLFAPNSDSEWRKQLSVSHACGMWTKLGAPKEKMVIGRMFFFNKLIVKTINLAHFDYEHIIIVTGFRYNVFFKF